MSSTEHPLYRASQQTFKSSKCIKILKRNCLFTAKFNFKIVISQQPNVVQTIDFQTINSTLSNIQKFPDQLAKILIFLKIPSLYTKRVDHIYESPNRYESRRLLIFGHSIFFRFMFSCSSSSLWCIQFCIIEYTAWMRKHNCISVDMSLAHRIFTFRTFCLKLTTFYTNNMFENTIKQQYASKKKTINLIVLFDIDTIYSETQRFFCKKCLLKGIESLPQTLLF